ncbi:bacteriocin-like protein [Chryseobacterium oleae]
MKNLRKLTKKQLKTIEGAALALACPPPATTCVQWCSWTAQQRRICKNMIMDADPCPC